MFSRLIHISRKCRRHARLPVSDRFWLRRIACTPPFTLRVPATQVLFSKDTLVVGSGSLFIVSREKSVVCVPPFCIVIHLHTHTLTDCLGCAAGVWVLSVISESSRRLRPPVWRRILYSSSWIPPLHIFACECARGVECMCVSESHPFRHQGALCEETLKGIPWRDQFLPGDSPSRLHIHTHIYTRWTYSPRVSHQNTNRRLQREHQFGIKYESPWR